MNFNNHLNKCCKIAKNQHNVSMDQFNSANFINRLGNQGIPNQAASSSGGPRNPDVQFQLPKSTEGLPTPPPQQIIKPQSAMLRAFDPSMITNYKMNNLPSLERSLYVKDLMNLPKEMEDVLVMLQKNTTLAKDAVKLLSENINMGSIAELMQKSGKEAMNKLIFAMSESAKQGINDTTQLKEAFRLINASVSVAGQENSAQTLKNFMLLYLPWLPLQEGVDFEFEMSGSDNPEDESEMSITIMISTKNYGNVRVTLILFAGNSMDIFVNCSDNFPKEDLMKRIAEENKKHSIQSSMSFEEKEMKQAETGTPQAKVSFSNLSEVNPHLLIMSNAIIRHTIELDNLAG